MILQEAILHIPLSQYAFANSEMNLTIRIRVAKDNLTDCVLWYGDRVQPGDPIVFTAVYMKKILSDMHFDYYDATFETPYDRVCYYFELKDPEETRFYYADICAKYLPVERSEFYQYPFIRREEICEEPKWFPGGNRLQYFPGQLCQRTPRDRRTGKRDGMAERHPVEKPSGRNHTGDPGESGLYSESGIQLYLPEPGIHGGRVS